jgi:hypothetical protein
MFSPVRIAQVAPLFERSGLGPTGERTGRVLSDRRAGAWLGLTPDAADDQLTLNRPRLPGWLSWIELRDLQLRTSRLTLRVSQGQAGAAIEMLTRDGDAELVVRR